MRTVATAVLLVGSGGIAVVGFGLSARHSDVAPGQKIPLGVLDAVHGYQNWAKANPKPVRLMTGLDVLCRGLTQDEVEKYQKISPHFQRYLTVYVNPIGQNAMMKGGTFPFGSVIVKEKREEGNRLDGNGPVVLSTVMIKREKGYNPACGDWEFAAMNPKATKTDGEGKLESCMKCHQEVAKKDFVFRSYVGLSGFGGGSGYFFQYDGTVKVGG